MSDYTAPDINDIAPSELQEQALIEALNAVEGVLAQYSRGRGAGKSTLRGFIAAAILEDGHPLYKVVPC